MLYTGGDILGVSFDKFFTDDMFIKFYIRSETLSQYAGVISGTF